jgi:hypothetical protein
MNRPLFSRFLVISASLLAAVLAAAGATQAATASLETVLAEDGSLDLGGGFQGSLDASGYTLLAAADGSPRFVSRSAGARAARAVPDPDDAWDARFFAGGITGTSFNPTVNAIAVIGADLYVAGDFAAAGTVAAANVARWDGSQWSALGGGADGIVNAMAVIGTDLYIGGAFNNVDGTPAAKVAKWDGSSWSALDSGVAATVNAMTVIGTDLYVGGAFLTAGGNPA